MRLCAALVLVLAGAAGVAGSEDQWVLGGRVGPFFYGEPPPRIEDPEISGSPSDLIGGLEFALRLGSHFEVSQHIDFIQSYDDDSSERPWLETFWLGATGRLLAGGPDSRLVPYIGVGIDYVNWRLDLTSRKLDGGTVGFHAAAGLRVFVSHSVALTLEGRYQAAEDTLRDASVERHLDLGGTTVMLGVVYRF